MKKQKRTRMHKYLRKDFRRQGRWSSVLPEINISRLAVEVGVSRSHLSKLVNCLVTTGPSLRLLQGLKTALGLKDVEAAQGWLKRVQGRSKGRGKGSQNSKLKKAG